MNKDNIDVVFSSMKLFLQGNFYISTYAAWDAILEYYNIFILEREEILIFRPQEMKIVDL